MNWKILDPRQLKLNARHSLTAASKVSKRFFLSIVSAFGLFASLYYLTLDLDGKSINELPVVFLALTFAMGIPLFTATHLFIERNKPPLYQSIALISIEIGYLYLFWRQSIPYSNTFDPPYVIFYKYGAQFLAVHGLLAISVFNRYSEVNDFWNFNARVLIRMLTGIFYTLVLALGLCGALAALMFLFDWDIKAQHYLQVLALLGSIYMTLYVLSGIKVDLNDYKKDYFYPAGLQIFTQFVLLPLIGLYLLILYAYELKIIALWSLPVGWVSNLILWFSIIGILAFLLVYPLRNNEKQLWIKKFSRLFYLAILPLIVLLFLAIFIRILTYGITIDRYIVLVLALWLAGITSYFLISRRDNIIYIPFSLSIIFLLSTFGPWGFDDIAAHSQATRLKTLMYKPEKVQKDLIDDVQYNILNYLIDYHGFKILRLLDNNEVSGIINSVNKHSSKYNIQGEIVESLGLTNTYPEAAYENYDFKATRLLSRSLSGNYLVIPLRSAGAENIKIGEFSFLLSDSSLVINTDEGENTIILIDQSQIDKWKSLEGKGESMVPYIKDATIRYQGKNRQLQITIYQLQSSKPNKSLQVSYIDAVLFLQQD